MATPYYEEGVLFPVIDIDLIPEPQKTPLEEYWNRMRSRPISAVSRSLRLMYWRDYQSWFTNVYSPTNCKTCR